MRSGAFKDLYIPCLWTLPHLPMWVPESLPPLHLFLFWNCTIRYYLFFSYMCVLRWFSFQFLHFIFQQPFYFCCAVLASCWSWGWRLAYPIYDQDVTHVLSVWFFLSFWLWALAFNSLAISLTITFLRLRNGKYTCLCLNCHLFS